MFMLILLAGYLAIGYLLHLVIFPERKPDIATYFKPGQVFYSKTEGFKQTVTKHENGLVHGFLQVEPFAAGPPKHIHDGFDEQFQIANGELTIWVDGEIKKIRPGEVLNIPKGTPHRPYNETADTIMVKGTFAFPEKFAYNLVQVYGCMDNTPGFTTSPKTMFQMALFQGAGFDSYMGEGPPVFMQKAVRFFVTPMARLMGYRSYYEKYDININPPSVGL